MAATGRLSPAVAGPLSSERRVGRQPSEMNGIRAAPYLIDGRQVVSRKNTSVRIMPCFLLLLLPLLLINYCKVGAAAAQAAAPSTAAAAAAAAG